MEYPQSKPLYSFEYRLRSRYSETDKMGYVYYGHYLQYFEVARTEMIRHLDVSYAELENRGIMLPVATAEIEYKSPVLYDEEIGIVVELFEMPSVRLTTYYKVISKETGQIKATGKVVLVFVDAQTRRPIKGYSPFNEAIQHANSLR